jgi:hypothetical protein
MSQLAQIGNGGQGLVTLASGLVVPAAVADNTADPRTDQGATAYDEDGRRRVVLSSDEQRLVDRTIKMLQSHGLGMVVGCRNRKDGKVSCGRPMVPEPLPGDNGFGCLCSRVHFTVR